MMAACESKEPALEWQRKSWKGRDVNTVEKFTFTSPIKLLDIFSSHKNRLVQQAPSDLVPVPSKKKNVWNHLLFLPGVDEADWQRPASKAHFVSLIYILIFPKYISMFQCHSPII